MGIRALFYWSLIDSFFFFLVFFPIPSWLYINIDMNTQSNSKLLTPLRSSPHHHQYLCSSTSQTHLYQLHLMETLIIGYIWSFRIYWWIHTLSTKNYNCQQHYHDKSFYKFWIRQDQLIRNALIGSLWSPTIISFIARAWTSHSRSMDNSCQ